MVIEEEGEFEIDTDHNVITLSYGVSETKINGDKKCISQGKWITRNLSYTNFQIDSTELDCIYGTSSVEMNNC